MYVYRRAQHRLHRSLKTENYRVMFLIAEAHGVHRSWSSVQVDTDSMNRVLVQSATPDVKSHLF